MSIIECGLIGNLHKKNYGSKLFKTAYKTVTIFYPVVILKLAISSDRKAEPTKMRKVIYAQDLCSNKK